MQLELLFLIVNFGILPFWLLLLVAPRWRATQLIVHSALIPAALGLLYIALLLRAPIPEGAGGGSLAAMMRLFDSPQVALAAWIHFIIFDLFVGAWQVRDAGRNQIRQLAIVPSLLLTLLYGPAGLLLYLVVRGIWRRRWRLDEAAT